MIKDPSRGCGCHDYHRDPCRCLVMLSNEWRLGPNRNISEASVYLPSPPAQPCAQCPGLHYYPSYRDVLASPPELHTACPRVLSIFPKDPLAPLRQVFVFLDEVNTAPHLGLVCEALGHRSLQGRMMGLHALYPPCI